MAQDFGTRKDKRVYPKNGEKIPLSKVIESLDSAIKSGVKKAANFPQVIVFDWNGTVDARGTGIGIPGEVLVALQKLGKTVIIYTSSVGADRKLFMRKWAEQHGIPYTDNSTILENADMYIGDKKSDEKRAGRKGINFVYTKDFSMEKVLPPIAAGKQVKGPGALAHKEVNDCTCSIIHPNQPHRRQLCDCTVVHPKVGEDTVKG